MWVDGSRWTLTLSHTKTTFSELVDPSRIMRGDQSFGGKGSLSLECLCVSRNHTTFFEDPPWSPPGQSRENKRRGTITLLAPRSVGAPELHDGVRKKKKWGVRSRPLGRPSPVTRSI